MNRMLPGLAGLTLLCAPAAPASAQTIFVSQHRLETTLILQVLPLEAEIVVDGRRLGTAEELTAQAISVAPGAHTIEISAPGFRVYTDRFVADLGSSVSQFHVTLAPR